jgi:hypothetical protein
VSSSNEERGPRSLMGFPEITRNRSKFMRVCSDNYTSPVTTIRLPH